MTPRKYFVRPSHFIDWEGEAQRSKVNCPRSYRFETRNICLDLLSLVLYSLGTQHGALAKCYPEWNLSYCLVK